MPRAGDATRLPRRVPPARRRSPQPRPPAQLPPSPAPRLLSPAPLRQSRAAEPPRPRSHGPFPKHAPQPPGSRRSRRTARRSGGTATPVPRSRRRQCRHAGARGSTDCHPGTPKPALGSSAQGGGQRSALHPRARRFGRNRRSGSPVRRNRPCADRSAACCRLPPPRSTRGPRSMQLRLSDGSPRPMADATRPELGPPPRQTTRYRPEASRRPS